MNTQEKTCQICGQDCAGRPRIKDPAGNYYHQECYDEFRLSRLKDPDGEEAAPAGETKPSSVLAAAIGEAAPQVAAPPVQTVEGNRCPRCGKPMPPGGDACGHCGHGAAKQAAVQSTALEPYVDPGAGEGAVWPTVIGVLSILIGAGGVAHQGANLALGVSQRQVGPWIVGPCLFGLLALWLIVAAVGVMRRRYSGPIQMKRWAVYKIVLALSCYGLSTIVLLSAKDLGETFGADAQGLTDETARTAMIATFLALLVLELIWPVFIMIWFRREVIWNQASKWK